MSPYYNVQERSWHHSPFRRLFMEFIVRRRDQRAKCLFTAQAALVYNKMPILESFNCIKIPFTVQKLTKPHSLLLSNPSFYFFHIRWQLITWVININFNALCFRVGFCNDCAFFVKGGRSVPAVISIVRAQCEDQRPLMSNSGMRYQFNWANNPWYIQSCRMMQKV